MPYYFKHPAGRFDLEDMPLDRWIVIQEQTGKQWHEVLSGQILGDAKVATAVVAQAAQHLGIDPPLLTLKTLMEVLAFEEAESLPAEYVDGSPDPKAPASEAATT